MPTDYRCSDCGLGLCVGWFHFHGPCEDYWAATLGFCRKCGTIHRLLHSSKKGPDKVSAAVGPVLASESALPGVGYVVRPQEWKDVEKADTCAHCGANGQLCFEQTETVESCPRCGCRSFTRLHSWIT